jgi:hypothetical protein
MPYSTGGRLLSRLIQSRLSSTTTTRKTSSPPAVVSPDDGSVVLKELIRQKSKEITESGNVKDITKFEEAILNADPTKDTDSRYSPWIFMCLSKVNYDEELYINEYLKACLG